jgi:hypothetical protein
MMKRECERNMDASRKGHIRRQVLRDQLAAEHYVHYHKTGQNGAHFALSRWRAKASSSTRRQGFQSRSPRPALHGLSSLLTGQEVAVLVNGQPDYGSYQVPFDATDLAGGIYIACLTQDEHTQTQKLLLVK